MKDRLFHWPTLWRHMLFGALPFLVLVVLYEKSFSEWSLGAIIIILAALLPFIAVGWLGYQYWKHRRKKLDHG